MAELFALPESLSPRLQWLRDKNVKTQRFPMISPGDEDEFGRSLFPWVAWIGPLELKSTRESFQAGGNTEMDAIANLAIKRRWRLWNETGFNAKRHIQT